MHLPSGTMSLRSSLRPLHTLKQQPHHITNRTTALTTIWNRTIRPCLGLVLRLAYTHYTPLAVLLANQWALRPVKYSFCKKTNDYVRWKIWGFHGSDYEECRLLGYKNQVRTSQETHYVSATESSQLMLCKIWGFHGGDYEKCRLLRYKNTFRTSQETRYVSVTESNQLMLCKIWGFHGGDYEEWRLLGCYAVWIL
jgi:hypothetical protein